MQIDHRFRLYGVLTSVALHGAVATAMIHQLATSAGMPTSADSRTVVADIQLVASAAPSVGHVSSSPPKREEPAATAEPKARKRADLGPSASRSIPPAASAPTGEDAPGPAATEAEGKARTDYESVLLAHLRNFLFYPDTAREQRLRGTVEVRLDLARNGRVLAARVQTSSGEVVLDEAALELIRRAQPMPAIPSMLPDRMDIYLPVEYLPPKMTIGSG